jgi:hypothetical protein
VAAAREAIDPDMEPTVEVRMPAPPASEPTATPPRPPRQRGLPRRTRQANLAPQLQHTAGPTLVADVNGASTAPSPEQIRERMSAFQTGTNRGRRDGFTNTGQEEIQ